SKQERIVHLQRITEHPDNRREEVDEELRAVWAHIQDAFERGLIRSERRPSRDPRTCRLVHDLDGPIVLAAHEQSIGPSVSHAERAASEIDRTADTAGSCFLDA